MAGYSAAVVVGVDGSAHSLRALDWAVREASVRQSPLRIVHASVWPASTGDLPMAPVGDLTGAASRHAAEQVLAAAADQARNTVPALDIRTALVPEPPAAALIAASDGAGLVVVGHRGLGGFTGLLVGSVGVQVTAHAACPVVVVRDGDVDSGVGAGGTAGGPVVVGVDGSDLSDAAVEFAFGHASRHGLGVVAVHAYTLPALMAPSDAWLVGSDVAGWHDDHARMLTEALAGYRDKYPDVPVREKVVPGRAAEVLVAGSAGAALTVVGSRGRGGLAGLVLGSTSQSVLHRAAGPVTVVPVTAGAVRDATAGTAEARGRGGATTRPRRSRPHPPTRAGWADGPTGAADGGRSQTDPGGRPAPEVSSFAKSLFVGRLPAAMVVPYPRLDRAENGRVDALVAAGREFLDGHYDPAAVERRRWVGDDIIRGLGERGLLGLYVAPEYGGQGLSQTGYCRVMEEFGGYDASLSVVMGVHQSIGMKPIHLFGTEDQKARYLPDLAAGRSLAGFALTEPGAGSDIRAISTTAQRQADGSYVLNGEKRWIGNGSKDVLCVFARSDNGPVALIVDSGMPGFDAPHRYDTLGLRGNDLRKLTFRDVRVPKDNVLGEPGDGLRIAMHTLNNGRMSLGTGVVGAVKRLIELAVEHVTGRHQFGRPLKDFELVEDKISWMMTYLYGFESMAYLTTGLVDAGVADYSLEAAMTKVAGSEFHWYAVNRVVQLLGGRAYMADHPVARALRDSRVFPIFEGSNDVLRAFVGLAGLKAVADEVADLRHLNLTDPVGSIGVITDYVGQRVRRRVRPDRLDTIHPVAAAPADRVTGQVRHLRTAAEKLLRVHGDDIRDRQRPQKRLAHAAVDIYAQIATVARTSAHLEDLGTTACERERHLMTAFCDRAAARVTDQLDRIDDNDDAHTHAIARSAYGSGAYTPRLP